MTGEIAGYALWAGLGYLIGSIPFGLLIARLHGLGDLRSTGSGNIGATNVLRVAGPASAIATMLLDGGKTALVYILVSLIAGENCALAAGFVAVLGHCFPVWLGFKGGKGASSSAGLILAMAWPVGVLIFSLWTILLLITSYASVAAIVVALVLPLVAWAFGAGSAQTIVMAMLSVLTLSRHIPNIRNLLQGKERKLTLWRR